MDARKAINKTLRVASNGSILRHVVALLAAAFLAACGGGGNGSSSGTASLAAATETIVPACPQDQVLPKKTIVFSAGYRVDGEKNIVELGTVSLCGDSWHIRFLRFDSAANSPRLRTSYRHQMRAPFRSPSCTDDYITTIAPTESVATRVELADNGNSLSISTGALDYHWIPDAALERAYTLSSIDQTSPGKLDQIAGFAFVADSLLKGSIRPAQIMALFNGDIFHKNSDMGVADNWLKMPFGIDFREFTAVQNNAVLVMTKPGSPNVIQQWGKPLWWQSSLVLVRSDSAVAPLIHVSGHDFNMNGCFDELGHNRLLLPVGSETQDVKALVYIEYSPESNDGFPMLSVGRYYRQSKDR